MNKFSIYGPMGVPEVWRYDGNRRTLTLYDRRVDGGYDETESSSALPQMPVALVRETLAQQSTASETKLVRAFREQVQKIKASDN